MSVNKTSSYPNLPIIDLTPYSLNIPDAEADQLLTSQSGVQLLADQLSKEMEKHRFVILINHGIQRQMIDQVFKEVTSFFNSSMEYKNKYITDTTHGYIPSGKEINETGDVLLGPSVEAFFAQIGPKFTHLIWPDDDFPGMQLAYTEWFRAANRLGGRIVDLLSLGLKLKDPRYLRSIHCDYEKNGHCTRVNYYKALPKQECHAGRTRFAQHFDYDTLSILATTGPGLQSQLNDGTFVDIPVIEDALIIQAGNALQEYSSDRISAHSHRVVTPSSPACYEDRFSVVTFFAPYPEAAIESLDGSHKYAPHPASTSTVDAYNQIFDPSAIKK